MITLTEEQKLRNALKNIEAEVRRRYDAAVLQTNRPSVVTDEEQKTVEDCWKGATKLVARLVREALDK